MACLAGKLSRHVIIMLTNEKGLSAEEKIKQLIELEKSKREELEAKKKELDQLESRRKKEIEDARKEIEDKIEELATEEKQRFEELEEIRRKKEAESSLEEAVEEEERKGRIRETPRQRTYGEIFEQIAGGNPTFYDLTNYNVINRLESIASEAGTRVLTNADKEFIQLVQYHAEKFGRDDFYKDKDESNYLARELAAIEQISKKAKDASIMTRRGDYQV